MLQPKDFFDLGNFEHKALFEGAGFVWDALGKLNLYLKKSLNPNVALLRGQGITLSRTCVLYKDEVIDKNIEIKHGDVTKGRVKVFRNGEELIGASVLYSGSVLFNDAVFIGKGTVVEPGAFISGPSIIGRNTEIRQGAYIRGKCIVGDRCVVGHATEMKNSIMLNDAKAGHFAYIGDSIIGNNVNLGAGTKCANLKLTHTDIVLKIRRKTFETGLRKLGAILGDNTETGCNSVTSPGSFLGRSSLVFPNVYVQSGYYPNNSTIRRSTRKS
jgi:NDP-sugar pyrophosphorylase family protein